MLVHLNDLHRRFEVRGTIRDQRDPLTVTLRDLGWKLAIQDEQRMHGREVFALAGRGRSGRESGGNTCNVNPCSTSPHALSHNDPLLAVAAGPRIATR